MPVGGEVGRDPQVSGPPVQFGESGSRACARHCGGKRFPDKNIEALGCKCPGWPTPTTWAPATLATQQLAPLSFTVAGALAVPLAVKPTVTEAPAARDSA